MKLIELSLEYSMDIGAPIPKILTSESMLNLFFFIGSSPRGISSNIISRDVISDNGVGVFIFDDYLSFKFGFPNDEVLQGHPYYELGLKPYSFFKLEESNWIKELDKIGSVHPMHRKDFIDGFHHYILTFKDSVFECLSSNYEIKYSQKSMGELLNQSIQDLILAE